MRKLTIQRHKTFVACAMKVKFYIVDESNYDITINGYKCKKLCDLKNNSETTIEIDENEHIIFAIIDKVSKEFCNDKITIPSGDTDVKISGKNKFAPFSGNPFIFNK